MKIGEQLENFEEYSGLNGLKIINLRTRTSNGTFTPVTYSGDIKDIINDGDTCYCDIYSEDTWIKAQFSIRNSLSSFVLKSSINVLLDYDMKKLKLILIKSALNYWKFSLSYNMEEGKEDMDNSGIIYNKKDSKDSKESKDNSKSYDEHNEEIKQVILGMHYFISECEISYGKTKISVPNDTFDDYIDNTIKTNKTSDYIILPRINHKLRSIFNYGSEINLKMRIVSIEECLFEHVQMMELRNNLLATRWAEFKLLEDFINFVESRSFERELRVLSKLVRNNGK